MVICLDEVQSRQCNDESDESLLLSLLQEVDELRSQANPGREGAEDEPPAIEREIAIRERRAIEILYGYLRRALPGLMRSLFGVGVVSLREDASVRFTEMLHSFLVKILEKRPDEFWRAKTARQLRQWASVANANLMRDVLRRERLGERIVRDQLVPLLTARSVHFEKTTHFPIDEAVLGQIEAWVNSRHRIQRQMGLVLRYRYLDGLPYSEIADMLQVSEATVQNRRSAAIEWLRSMLSQG